MSDRRREYLNLTQQICEVCHEPIYSGQKDEAHHGGVHDTAGNREHLPLYTNSLMCRVRLHAECHAAKPGHGRAPEGVPDLWERFLTAYVALLAAGESINLNMVRKELEILRDEMETSGRI